MNRGVIEKLLEQYKHSSSSLRFSKRETLLRSVAWQQAVKQGTHFTEMEMRRLLLDLFQCQQPQVSPDGTVIYLEFTGEQLERLFGQRPA